MWMTKTQSETDWTKNSEFFSQLAQKWGWERAASSFLFFAMQFQKKKKELNVFINIVNNFGIFAVCRDFGTVPLYDTYTMPVFVLLPFLSLFFSSLFFDEIAKYKWMNFHLMIITVCVHCAFGCCVCDMHKDHIWFFIE